MWTTFYDSFVEEAYLGALAPAPPVLRFKKIVNQTVSDRVAHSKNPRKCAYHVTFDLDLDLEHTMDAR